jgi:hypothetical protein
MVMTIAPRSVGHSKDAIRSPTLLPFAVGAMSSGAIVFVGLALLGGVVLPDTGGIAAAVLVAAAGVTVLYGLSYVAGRPLPVPTSSRQVPKLWREAFSPATAAILYGGGLGLGFFTRGSYLTFYAAAGIALVSREPLLSALAGVTFGLARTLPLVLYRARGTTLGKAEGLVSGLREHERKIQVLNGVVLTGLGLLLLALSA